MAAGIEAQELIMFVEDPGDETGNTYRCKRTEAWNGFGRGWTDMECALAGAAVTRTLLERYDGDTEEALTMATRVAIQHPPLLGSKLVEFTAGAKAAIQAQEA